MTTFITIFNLSCILTCFILALVKGKHDHWLKAAFLFTLISDLILAKNHTAPIGVLIFSLAQLAHLIRLADKKLLKIYLPLAAIALIAGIALNNLIIYAAVYSITEILNFALALRYNKQLIYGFGLFLACDLCVAIGFLAPDLTSVMGYVCWVFYLPSQFLLATSQKTVLK